MLFVTEARSPGSGCCHQRACWSPKDLLNTSPRLQSESVNLLLFYPSSYSRVSASANRFDIDDRKGLEIVMLTALLTFHDANDTYHKDGESPSSTSFFGVRRTTSEAAAAESSAAGQSAPPTLPPKPTPRGGIDRIAEMQAIQGEYNEVTVSEEGSIEDYGQYCFNLLQVSVDLKALVSTTKSCRMTLFSSSRFVLQGLSKSRRLFRWLSRQSECAIRLVCGAFL